MINPRDRHEELLTLQITEGAIHYRGGTGGGSAVRSDHDVGAVRGALYDGIPHWPVRGSSGPGYS